MIVAVVNLAGGGFLEEAIVGWQSWPQRKNLGKSPMCLANLSFLKNSPGPIFFRITPFLADCSPISFTGWLFSLPDIRIWFFLLYLHLLPLWASCFKNHIMLLTPKFIPVALTLPLNFRHIYSTAYLTSPPGWPSDMPNFICPKWSPWHFLLLINMFPTPYAVFPTSMNATITHLAAQAKN